MAQAHGHPLLTIALLGGGAYLLYRTGVLTSILSSAGVQAPTPVAAPGAAYDPSVNPDWTVEPDSVIAATEADSGVLNPFDALVAAYPRGALTEEYQAWLHRAPDAAGEAYWLDWIAQRKAAGQSPYQTGGDLITAFQTSKEAQAVNG